MSSNCGDLIPGLQQSIGFDRTGELYFWLKTVQCYDNVVDVMNKLQLSGLSNGKIDGPFHISHFGRMISAPSPKNR